MFKNMSPKMKVITIVAIILIIALIIFFVVRARKNKKKSIAQSESSFSGHEPTPAEGGDFRVVPPEDNPSNIPDAKMESEKPKPRPAANNQPQQTRPAANNQPPQVRQRPHLNTSGKTKGGELPPMDEEFTVADN